MGVHCGLVQHYCTVTPSWNSTRTSQGSDYNPVCSRRGQDLVLEHLWADGVLVANAGDGLPANPVLSSPHFYSLG